MSKCVGMLTGDKWSTKIDYMRRVYSVDDISPTIATVTGGGMEVKILVRHGNSKNGYYKPIHGGACSMPVSRGRKTDEEEYRKEER